MALITCPDCGKEFSDSAAACPNCARPNNAPAAKPRMSSGGCAGIGCLSIIVLAVIGSIISDGGGSSQPAVSQAGSSSALPVITAPKLELISWNWHDEYGYVIAEGRVKNISNERLEGVDATVTFMDKAGEFITSDDALIDLNPILPGQTSSFKVMGSYNPAMTKANVDFKELFGGAIPWRLRTKAK